MCMHFYTRYSQYSSSLSDLIGYVQGLSDLLTSKYSGNKYFQVRLKTSEKNIDIVKFMKKQNPTIKLQLFKEKMDASHPIKLSNLTEVNTGAIFFNSNRGSRIEDVFAVPFMNTLVDDLKLIDIKGKFSGTFNLKGISAN